ncbi:hypothetical protein P7C71_g3471, partial [Lecanoromycetidae sp. Uapishka_2]
MGNPWFSVPGNLTWVDPAWTSCIPVSYGIYDPPRKLDKTSAPLVAPTPVAAQSLPVAEAAPASTAVAPVSPATSAAAVNPVIVAPNPVATNQGADNPDAVTPGSTPTSTSVDPDDESAAQISALHQALAPAPVASPAAQPAESAVEQADGQVNAEPITTNAAAVQPAAAQPAAAQPAAAQPAAAQPAAAQPAAAQPAAAQPATAQPAAAQAAAQPAESVVEQSNGQVNAIPNTTPVSSPVVMASPSPAVIAGVTATPAANGGVILASSTYTPGSKATVAGKVYSVGSSVIQDENSQTYSIQPTPTPVLLAGNSISKAAGGGVVIASSTYSPGAQGQVAGTSFSVGADNVAVAGSTHALPASPSQTPVLVNDQSLSRASNGGVVVGSSTIPPGEQATVSNHVISAGLSNAVVDGTNYALPTSAGAVLQQAPAQQQAAVQQSAPAEVGGQEIVKAANGGVVIGGSTIPVGGQATIQDHVVSVGPSSIAVDGSTTYALPTSAGAIVQTPVSEQQTPVLVGGNSITRASNGGIVVGTATIPPGSQTTVAGNVISAGAGSSNDVVINGSTQTLATSAGAVLQTPAPQQQQSPVVLGSSSITRAPNGEIMVGATALPPGSQAIVAGHIVSVASNNANVVIDGTTESLPTSAGAVLQTPAPQQAPLVIGNQEISRGSNGAILIGTSTLQPGAQTTFDGHTISAAANNNNVIVDGTTESLPTTAGAVLETPVPTQAPVLIGGAEVERAQNGGLVIGTTTLPPGAVATIAGHTISAVANSDNVIVDGTNYALPTTPGAVLQTVASPIPTSAPTSTPEPVVTLANGALISAGGPAATISGMLASVLPDDSGIVIGSTTYPFPSSAPAAPSSVFTVGGQTITAKPSGFVIAPGETVMPGGSAVTLRGTVVSLDKSGDLQIGSSTVALVASPTDGGYVAGIAYPSSTGSSTATPYQGGSSRQIAMSWSLKLCAAIVWSIGLILWY